MSFQTIGAWINNGICHFRVWAPHVDDVQVLLQSSELWNSTGETRTESLTINDDGYWTLQLDNVEPDTLYRYAISKDAITRQKLDPAARDVIHSGLTRFDPDNGNAGIILAEHDLDWPPFITPAFENFIIYQFHIGSFAGRNDHLDNTDIAGFADVSSKFGYIREQGFNAIEMLPVHEFAADRSWGYNPASFFAPESAYGSSRDLQEMVIAAHREGLAVIFDVVYNHAGPGDSVLWNFGAPDPHAQGGIYFEGGRMTYWGRGPAWWKQEVKDFFFENARMFFEDYKADGLRFDATTQINGNDLRDVIWQLKQLYPDKYLIAEHLPAHPWITTFGNFDASWHAKTHHQFQRALNSENPIDKLKSFLGWDGFKHAWNLVKYTLGLHDDCGDQENGNAENGLDNWDQRHRYLVDLFGGRDNWHARAQCRLAWALNIAMPGTPMLFMGSECYQGAPTISWGYWHDGEDLRGDHRFDWQIAGDPIAMQMRRLVTAANQARWSNPALRSDTLIICHEDYNNQVLAFKRWRDGNVILTIVNLSETNFTGHNYGIATDRQFGQWQQILCSQDAVFGGWDGAGNAFYEPWTQADGRIYINLPKWGVVMFRLK